jgi:hypothetical protein
MLNMGMIKLYLNGFEYEWTCPNGHDNKQVWQVATVTGTMRMVQCSHCKQEWLIDFQPVQESSGSFLRDSLMGFKCDVLPDMPEGAS